MKTESWIDMLAMHVEPAPAGAVQQRVATGAGMGMLGAAVLMVAWLGVRHDLATAATQPMFWVKIFFAISLAIMAAVLVARLGQPGRPVRRTAGVAGVPVAALWVLAAVVLAGAPVALWPGLFRGSTWIVCPWLIATLSVPALAATLWVMRGLAPTRLRAAGAAAGLLAGALATLVYALHCPEMAAPFIATWYVVGIAVPTAAGALLGPRWLRW